MLLLLLLLLCWLIGSGEAVGPTEKQREEGRKTEVELPLTERDWCCVRGEEIQKIRREIFKKPEWEIPSERRSVNHMKIG